jgi:gluconate 2-dehydrogenase gamma chain
VAPPTRRQFVQQITVAGAGGCVALAAIGCRPRPAAPPAASAPPPDTAPPLPSGFTTAQLATIAAVCERILPRDQDPGAIDLGVPVYIDRAMTAPELAGHRDLIVSLLPLLDRHARQRFGGRSFAEAAPDQQDSLLSSWQHGRGGDRRFFEVMLGLTLEGAFGAPSHGGNRGGRGFDLIGFTPGPVMSGPHGSGHAPAPRVGAPG